MEMDTAADLKHHLQQLSGEEMSLWRPGTRHISSRLKMGSDGLIFERVVAAWLAGPLVAVKYIMEPSFKISHQ
jgi:hypothetical protein